MAQRRTRQRVKKGVGKKHQVSGFEYPSQYKLSDRSQARKLHANRVDAFWNDHRWKKKHVDYDAAAKLVDAKSGDTDEDGVPNFNAIRPVVKDLKSVSYMNIQGAHLKPMPLFDPSMPDEERRIVAEVMATSGRHVERLVRTIHARNQLMDWFNDVVDHAAVYGMGLATEMEPDAPSTLHLPELATLLLKPRERWTSYDFQRFWHLENMVEIRAGDPRDWYYSHGVRSFKDKEMLRASEHQIVDTAWLRHQYDDEKVMPGGGALGLSKLRTDSKKKHGATGVVTTWEIERFRVKERLEFFMGAGTARDNRRTIVYHDGFLVKTVWTATHVLDHQVFDSQEAVIALPTIPFYMDKAQEHPYGFGLPAQLALANKFVNRLRNIIYTHSLNAVSPNAIAVMLEALGTSDRQTVKDALLGGGIAFLEGNGIPISEAIAPLNRYNPGVNLQAAQALQMEEAKIDRQGGMVNMEGFNRVRSALGKQAHVAHADRPKTFMTGYMAEFIETLYERTYRWCQVKYGGEEVTIPVRGDTGTFEPVAFNRQVTHGVPMLDAFGQPMTDPAFESPVNPEGFMFRLREVVENNLLMEMHVQAEGRSKLPVETMNRLYTLAAMADAEIFMSRRTARDMMLDDEMRALDDRNAEQDAMEMQNQMLMQMMMQLQGGQAGAPGGPAGGPGGGQGLPAGAGGAQALPVGAQPPPQLPAPSPAG